MCCITLESLFYLDPSATTNRGRISEYTYTAVSVAVFNGTSSGDILERGRNSFPECIYLTSHLEAPAKVKEAIAFVLQELAVPCSHTCTYLGEVRVWKKFLASRPEDSLSASHGTYINCIYYCNGCKNEHYLFVGAVELMTGISI